MMSPWKGISTICTVCVLGGLTPQRIKYIFRIYSTFGTITLAEERPGRLVRPLPSFADEEVKKNKCHHTDHLDEQAPRDLLDGWHLAWSNDVNKVTHEQR